MTCGGFYILSENKPVQIHDPHEWSEWMQSSKQRFVETTEFILEAKDKTRFEIRVSTVFLGIDHNFHSTKGPPVLWETMIFGAINNYQRRYDSLYAAVIGHEEAVDYVKDVILGAKEVPSGS